MRILIFEPMVHHAIQHLSQSENKTRSSDYLFSAVPDFSAFLEEYSAFKNTLSKYASLIELNKSCFLQHEKKLILNPNVIYTRDVIITLPWFKNGYIMAQMKETIRQNEPPILKPIIDQLGLTEIMSLEPNQFLEGGDVIPVSLNNKRILFVGYGNRTSLNTLHSLKYLIDGHYVDEIIGVQLEPWVLHLDICLMVLTHYQCAILCSKGIGDAIQITPDHKRKIDFYTYLGKKGLNLIDVTPEEALQQSCNYLIVHPTTLIGYDSAERINDTLRKIGVKIEAIKSSELIKGMGGVRCMTQVLF